jgi:decaprenyl-phosphate phosphoribosyltransferase
MELFQLLRPFHWVKNLLVFAAPIFAGKILERSVLIESLLAFLAFSLVASSVYVLNDVYDLKIDSSHPTKSDRPLASGTVGKLPAYLICSAALISGLFIANLVSQSFLLVVIFYFASSNLYTFRIKQVPVVEFMFVSLGFALRAIGGGVATHTSLTEWFLMVTISGSMVLIVEKRLGEKRNVPVKNQRIVLQKYSIDYLQSLLIISVSILVFSYSVWAFSLAESFPFAAMSVFFVIIQIFRVFKINK